MATLLLIVFACASLLILTVNHCPFLFETPHCMNNGVARCGSITDAAAMVCVVGCAGLWAWLNLSIDRV